MPDEKSTKDAPILFYDTPDYQGPRYNAEAPWPDTEGGARPPGVAMPNRTNLEQIQEQKAQESHAPYQEPETPRA